MIRLAGLSEIDAIWPRFRDGFQEACRRGGGDMTDWYLFQNVRTSNALLFVEEDKAAFIVRPEKWGDERVLRVIACTGREMAEWLPEVIQSDVWRKYVGNLPLLFDGREGWRRELRKHGVRVLRTLYRLN